jgi:hypothetical protein
MIVVTSIVSANNLQAMQALAETAPLGCFVEVGVYKGGSASVLYNVAIRQGRELHLFDTFTGTPCSIDGLDPHKVDDEFAAPNAPKAIGYWMPAAKLHIGIYPATHPAELADIAFIHCDCDQYESYRAVIEKMWPLVVHEGILLFDDYPYLPGAKKAVEETFMLSDLQQSGSRFYVVKGHTIG